MKGIAATPRNQKENMSETILFVLATGSVAASPDRNHKTSREADGRGQGMVGEEDFAAARGHGGEVVATHQVFETGPLRLVRHDVTSLLFEPQVLPDRKS